MFGTIASRYDLINHIISFNTDKNWRKKASSILSVCKPKRILDVACGTADLAIALHKSIPEAEITGIDISSEMLKLGNEKIRKGRQISNPNAGLSAPPLQIILKEGDAESLEFPSSSFDAVTISFGIRNIRDRKKALWEFHRVLKDRGMLLVLEFSLPQKGLFSLIYRGYFYTLLPLIGGLISWNLKAYSYFVKSVRDFPAPVEFIELLERCGFHIEYTISLTGGAAWIYLASKTSE